MLVLLALAALASAGGLGFTLGRRRGYREGRRAYRAEMLAHLAATEPAPVEMKGDA